MQQLKGTVVSAGKMTNTVAVNVDSSRMHSLYGKRFKTRKRYLVHCSDSNAFAVGDSVEIVSCKPVSKRVKFKIVE